MQTDLPLLFNQYLSGGSAAVLNIISAVTWLWALQVARILSAK